jgi:hypothetical protein
MKYDINAREPMFYPLGHCNTLEEARAKVEAKIKFHSVIEVVVYDEADEIDKILTFERAK